tara:strand:- start:2635 stop:3651 length:1017 start_codon:yes stop_codon:yes gene_type:complete
MKFEDGIKLDFDDVLIKPKRSTLATRSGVDINKSHSYLHSDIEETIVPIVSANMDTTGSFAMAKALSKENAQVCLDKHYTENELKTFFRNEPILTNAWYTIGIKDYEVERLNSVREACGGINKICIDVANGYQKVFVDHVKRVRSDNPNAVIMAGNVCTPEMVSELLISGGADIVKIGIGPGSVCATRKITGCGYPQLSAIIECADAAHGVGGHICADGGCREAGDVVKAFAAGADFVMLGGMLAGTDECEGEWEYSDGGEKVALKFYGMSSEEAMNKHGSGMGSYRASEGIVKSVPYKGSVSSILQEITGGIRSACAYVGAPTLKDLPKCATFVIRR